MDNVQFWLCALIILFPHSVRTDDKDDESLNWIDKDNDEDLSPIQVDSGVSTGKMTLFFEKLNSMRRERLEERSKLLKYTSPSKPGYFTTKPDGFLTLLPPLTTKNSQKVVGPKPALALDPVNVERSSTNAPRGTTNGRPRRRQVTRPVAGGRGNYLRMGWRSARCLWRQYLNSGTEQESLSARERLGDIARFWAAAVGASVLVLWAAFGTFHGLFCKCMIVAPAEYAAQVNKYLTMVPPHVVVTDRGKMFRYRPTAEERFLWESAKKIANFRI